MISDHPLLLSPTPSNTGNRSSSFNCLFANATTSYVPCQIRSSPSEMPSFVYNNENSSPPRLDSYAGPSRNPFSSHNIYRQESHSPDVNSGTEFNLSRLRSGCSRSETQRGAVSSHDNMYGWEQPAGTTLLDLFQSEAQDNSPEIHNFVGTFEVSSTGEPPSVQKIENAMQQAGSSRHHGSKVFEVERSGTADDGNDRQIYINDPKQTNDKYEFTGNEIRTSKYTLISFIPKNLFVQFHRLAYIYFLVIAVLNQLPQLAVFGRTVSLFPLLFVLCVTAIKDGYEDWRRHRSDKKENNREVQVLQGDQFKPKKWKDVRVGEILKMHANETIPCDIVLLETSDPSGIAYVQTINLDGESNLKTRYARQETAAMKPERELPSGIIRCEQPNRNVYGFIATMEIGERRIPLGPSNIVLRGCQLKNTAWVVGVVVYAGQETKAMLNSSGAPSKRSRLEGHMNRETVWLSVFLFIMCTAVAFGMAMWLEKHREELDTSPFYRKIIFTKENRNGEKYNYYGIGMETVFSFLSSVIVFQIMIPISLYISMELVRLGQSYFMIGDEEMYDSNSNSRFQCRSLNINEDLGQIRYIFSDKTGTLTENKMKFRNASICGVNYCNAKDTVDYLGLESSGKLEERESIAGSIEEWRLIIQMSIDHLTRGIPNAMEEFTDRVDDIAGHHAPLFESITSAKAANVEAIIEHKHFVMEHGRVFEDNMFSLYCTSLVA